MADEATTAAPQRAKEDDPRLPPGTRTREQVRLDDLEQRVEALSFALAAVAPDSALLLTALLAAPRSGWKAVLDAYAIGQARKQRGAGI